MGIFFDIYPQQNEARKETTFQERRKSVRRGIKVTQIQHLQTPNQPKDTLNLISSTLLLITRRLQARPHGSIFIRRSQNSSAQILRARNATTK
jgi:hypothetical protein